MYNRRLDKLHAYAKGGRKPWFILVWGIPVFNMSRADALEYYWNLLEMKHDVMKTFYFTNIVQVSMLSVSAIVIGILTWIW